MGKWKDNFYNFLVRKHPDVRYEYERYVMEHLAEHYESRGKHVKILFKLKWHYQVRKRTEPMLYWDRPENQQEKERRGTYGQERTEGKEKVLYYENDYERPSVQEFAAQLFSYDVISFDIFDTLIYRKVEKPNDVFYLMSAEMGWNDFTYIRKRAETEARNEKERREGTREVVLSEIYDVLERYYDVDRSFMEREMELELELSMANPYIHQVYHILCVLSKELDKKIVFTTDMYLPLETIQKLLKKNGYEKYDEIILSNEYGLRKGDGTLQQVLKEHYPDKKIIHVGDNRQADVEKTIAAGIAAVYNPDSHFVYREPELENIAGSFYRAVIQTNMNAGLWEKDLYYSHGYRVGGILAAGYCEFINQTAKKRGIDKILFCARDCDIIYKLYNQFYKEVENAYIQASRYALFQITTKHFLYDLEGRYILRYLKMYRSSKTIETILEECGFGYLTEDLETYNLDRYRFPCSVDENRLHQFIYGSAEKIKEHNTEMLEAAKKYFSEMIGESKTILVADIGWAGTCISALKYFIKEYLPEKDCRIYGVLMCTNRNDMIKNSIQFEELDAYINTPFDNMDLTRYIFPGPPRSRSVKIMDKLHMPVEYLFTSTEPSLLAYRMKEDQTTGFVYSDYTVPNPEQITAMQQGMTDFVQQYLEYSGVCRVHFRIPPYTAFLPLREAISHEEYSYAVYKDFLYDAMSLPYANERVPRFSELFDWNCRMPEKEDAERSDGRKRILFVSPEMIYSGAPRSLLRMCRVAERLGYAVSVWSAGSGPFMEEFEKLGISVRVVREDEADTEEYRGRIASFDLAVCNTIMTSRFAEVCCQYIPTVWYIREATNIPDFIVNNFEREYVLKNSLDIYCVSEYAKAALEKFTHNPVHVVHNCVEDETEFALSYCPGSGEKVKFVQFGTMEYRKGYDVLLAAYQNMPKDYQDRSELYFAGGFINSGTPFCSYLFRQMQGEKNVHYLGLVRGEQNKIRTLSGMDVVVVASRDESCSLVALEGAMLSKPLIVTENVGAKYIVSEENGYIAETGDAESLMAAMMRMIDRKEELNAMGEASRRAYEAHAGMEAYTKDMQKLYHLTGKKGTQEQKQEAERNRQVFSGQTKEESRIREEKAQAENRQAACDAVVSLTSHPGRMSVAGQCIRSLTAQTVRPYRILLWLSKEQFPEREAELPGDLLSLRDTCEYFEIRWVEGDLKPHKKYFYAMQEYPERPVIVADDDVIYEDCLVERLMDSYRKFPDCISAMRANLLMFRRDGSIMDYEGWLMDYKALLDIPSTQLVPTGVGGVLYPPGALPKEAFDEEAITENCLLCDDLWLKIFASHAGRKTVVPRKFCQERLIEGSQEVALWRMNVRGDNNDVSLKNILNYYGVQIGDLDHLMDWLQRDRFA